MTTTGARIERLPRPEAARLRSSLVIPSLPTVLNELVQNALDAGGRRIDCWVNLVKGNESVRIEDDGSGISLQDLEVVGERHATSKPNHGFSASETYGFRGEALASIMALALVEVTSRVEGTYSKIVKNGKTIYLGPARADLAHRGTVVVVRDLFNAIPVRQAQTAMSGTLAACRRVIEVLALVHPTVRWTLWEDRPGGAKKILTLYGGKNSLDVFRSIHGTAGVERVQKVHVSAASRRIDGFISIDSGVTKAHQHLYVNGYPLEASELHQAISARFAASQFSHMASDLTDDGPTDQRASPRRLQRHPVYVLNITLPSEEVDAAYEPRKSVLGYKDFGRLQSFVIAVVDDFLRRQGFGHHRAATVSPTPSPTKRARSTAGSPLRPPRRAVVGHTARSPPVVPGELSPNWISDLVKRIDDGVLPIRACTHAGELSTELTTEIPAPLTDISFPMSSLATARVLRQVDCKFIPCIMRCDATATSATRDVLVVFDQHAADERASVENILDTLCDGFAHDNMATTELPQDAVRIVLTRAEAEVLGIPVVRTALRRWGMEFTTMAESDYVQVGVKRYPSLLDRLGRKEGREITRLLKIYLPFLSENLGELGAFLESGSGVMRWMPQEMLELANSKACRGAIMFEDRLDLDQCERLISRLAATKNPWVCAHGRPTFVPLRTLDGREVKRAIDWKKWKECSL